MNETIKLGVVLLIITSVAAAILGLSNAVTEDKIAEAINLQNEQARLEVLPIADKFESFDISEVEDDKVIEVYKGLKDGQIVGYTVKTATSSYGGNIEVMTAVSAEGEITGVKVVAHQDTPGLGANSTKPEFQNQYKGKNVGQQIIVVKTEPTNNNEIQAITGATITSNGVTNGVNTAIELFNNYLNK